VKKIDGKGMKRRSGRKLKGERRRPRRLIRWLVRPAYTVTIPALMPAVRYYKSLEPERLPLEELPAARRPLEKSHPPQQARARALKGGLPRHLTSKTQQSLRAIY
jgi:hypothetical protein